MRFNNNMNGAGLMTGCAFAHVITVAFMKLVFCEIALFQANFPRSMINVPPVLFMAWITKVVIRNLPNWDKCLITERVGAEFCATSVCRAIKHMSLANVTAFYRL